MYQIIQTIVFSAGENGGNPCPVVRDADELSTEDMQAMTAELGFESVYILKPTRPDCDVYFRYFVPLHEMEMCVHATIAAVTTLVRDGIITKSPISIQMALGKISVTWEHIDAGILVAVNQFLPRKIMDGPSKEELCRALRISSSELDELPCCSVATSRYKLIVPLKSTAVLNNLNLDFPYLWELCDKYGTTGFYPFTQEHMETGEIVYHARQFPKRAGYNEDPATGVAASALGAYLAQFDVRI
ncbi:MAG: PhzF family phenazine biosynthesis isomerase [Lachnospiraceae bacterium]|nr:PhzF family phenazine biosynthesis isomerase [Lachnospiraceae bacterium]